jgi:LysR family transcriptional regulator, positive regulator for ilvC
LRKLNYSIHYVYHFAITAARNLQQERPLNFDQLETFLITADQLHFGRASRLCNLSPSALTRTIQRLEEEIGEPLFLRDNRSVTLTDAGRKLQTYAQNTLIDWKLFCDSIAPAEAIGGPLSIYASVTAVYSLLPDLLERFRAAFPHVQLELRTGAAEQAVEQVQNGEIDLAVAALPDRHLARLEFLPLTETPLLFIAKKGASDIPYSKQQLDLRRAPLVIPHGGLSRHRLTHWLKKNKITPNISSEVMGNEAIIAMVYLGCGIGIVPELVLERSPFRNEVEVIKNAPKLEPYTVGLCTTCRNLKRPAVQAFWKLASDSLTSSKPSTDPHLPQS